MVTIQPEKEVTVSNYNTSTRVVSVSVQDGTSPTTPTHCRADQDTEPQDLTPIQPENVTSLNPQISHSSPDTPGKKERNSRKQCPYCNKGTAKSVARKLLKICLSSDFHEMSLKRHIKDVHFKNQNTYVICPQCCKQYASQNSLYSHLNRVSNICLELRITS